MNRFAALLDRLVLTPQRNVKLRLITDYLRQTPDPDRGYALAALTGDLSIASVKPAMLRALITDRMDPVLFGYSYDYVGDLAETIALAWPERHGSAHSRASGNPATSTAERVAPGSPLSRGGAADGGPSPALASIVGELQLASRLDGPRLMAEWLDQLDPTGRWGLIKLVTGGLRVGVSARLAKTAAAELGGKSVSEIEEVWHGLSPPYRPLFAWLIENGPRPVSRVKAPFRPVMLSHAIADNELPAISPEEYAAEWKWDGIRVQAVAEAGTRRLYSRTGEDISGSFPDIIDGLDFEGSIDGELLVGRETSGAIAARTFADLQQRLNRKIVSARLQQSHPAFIRAYDCLVDGTEDIRSLPFRERRLRLETLVAASRSGRIDLSPLVRFHNVGELAEFRVAPPEAVVEGIMLKRRASVYEAGRPKGPWFKWKRDPHIVDAVLMYAQRGHGKRSSYYSDYTFGVWRDSADGDELVPVGKAYFGFTDEELMEIDRFVRNNTVARFGPVREVIHEPDAGLVFEVAFEGLNRSTRHKSGVAMRFPRISRLRWDKPPAEADRLETLQALIPRGTRR